MARSEWNSWNSKQKFKINPRRLNHLITQKLPLINFMFHLSCECDTNIFGWFYLNVFRLFFSLYFSPHSPEHLLHHILSHFSSDENYSEMKIFTLVKLFLFFISQRTGIPRLDKFAPRNRSLLFVWMRFGKYNFPLPCNKESFIDRNHDTHTNFEGSRNNKQNDERLARGGRVRVAGDKSEWKSYLNELSTWNNNNVPRMVKVFRLHQTE